MRIACSRGRRFLVPSHVLVAPLQGLQECTRGVLLLNGHSVHFSNIGVLKTGSNLANKRLKPANEYSTVKFVTHSSCAGLIVVFHISLLSSCCCTDYPTQFFPFVFMCHLQLISEPKHSGHANPSKRFYKRYWNRSWVRCLTASCMNHFTK